MLVPAEPLKHLMPCYHQGGISSARLLSFLTRATTSRPKVCTKSPGELERNKRIPPGHFPITHTPPRTATVPADNLFVQPVMTLTSYSMVLLFQARRHTIRPKRSSLNNNGERYRDESRQQAADEAAPWTTAHKHTSVWVFFVFIPGAKCLGD